MAKIVLKLKWNPPPEPSFRALLLDLMHNGRAIDPGSKPGHDKVEFEFEGEPNSLGRHGVNWVLDFKGSKIRDAKVELEVDDAPWVWVGEAEEGDDHENRWEGRITALRPAEDA